MVPLLDSSPYAMFSNIDIGYIRMGGLVSGILKSLSGLNSIIYFLKGNKINNNIINVNRGKF